MAIAATLILVVFLSSTCAEDKATEDAFQFDDECQLGDCAMNALQVSANKADEIRTIYIVRHAERDHLWSCLNSTGWSRAGSLLQLFNGTHRQPKAIFAYNYAWIAQLSPEVIEKTLKIHMPTSSVCERCFQTATPIATTLGLQINHKYSSVFGYAPFERHFPQMSGKVAAPAMIQALAETGGPILVVWESMNTQSLLGDLGLQQPPKWPSENNYGRYYKVNFASDGSTWKLLNYSVHAQAFTSHMSITGCS